MKSGKSGHHEAANEDDLAVKDPSEEYPSRNQNILSEESPSSFGI